MYAMQENVPFCKRMQKAIKSDEDQKEVSVVRVQAMKEKAVLKCWSSRNLSDFKLTVELVLTFYHTSMWEM